MIDIGGAYVLVTGGTGFLGGAIVDRLLAEGARVRAVCFRRPPNRRHDRLEWLTADLRDPAACVAAAAGVELVVHAAANTSGAAAIAATPVDHVTPNVVMNAQLFEAAYRARVRRLLFIGSGAAYPDLGPDHRLTEADMALGDPPDVYFPAGWMKRYAEILCRMYATKLANPMPAVVLRVSNVYGPGDKFDFARSHVTAALIRRVVERHRPLEVWGTGDDVRDLIYVDDVVESAMRALSADLDQSWLAVNIASGRAYSIKEILQVLLAVDGFDDAEVVFDPSKPRTVGKRLFDVSLARETLGFVAGTALEDGLRRTLTWYRQGLAR